MNDAYDYDAMKLMEPPDDSVTCPWCCGRCTDPSEPDNDCPVCLGAGEMDRLDAIRFRNLNEEDE